MKEQSHKQEMSAAVRGDFARLRARGVGVESTIAQDGEPVPTPPDEPAQVEPDTPPTAPERRLFRIFRSG